MTRSCGRCPVGERLVAPVPHGHWKVLTTIAAMTVDGMLSRSHGRRGDRRRRVFRARSSRDTLVPALRPGLRVVTDNLSSHKVAGVAGPDRGGGGLPRALPAAVLAGPEPDRERAFSKIKARLQHLAARTVETLGRAVADAVASVTRSDAVGFFQHCGYVATLA